MSKVISACCVWQNSGENVFLVQSTKLWVVSTSKPPKTWVIFIRAFRTKLMCFIFGQVECFLIGVVCFIALWIWHCLVDTNLPHHPKHPFLCVCDPCRCVVPTTRLTPLCRSSSSRCATRWPTWQGACCLPPCCNTAAGWAQSTLWYPSFKSRSILCLTRYLPLLYEGTNPLALVWFDLFVFPLCESSRSRRADLGSGPPLIHSDFKDKIDPRSARLLEDTLWVQACLCGLI